VVKLQQVEESLPVVAVGCAGSAECKKKNKNVQVHLNSLDRELIIIIHAKVLHKIEVSFSGSLQKGCRVLPFTRFGVLPRTTPKRFSHYHQLTSQILLTNITSHNAIVQICILVHS